MRARRLARHIIVAAFFCYGFGLQAEPNSAAAQGSETIARGHVDLIADLPKGGPYVGEPFVLKIRSYAHGNVARDRLIQPVLINFNWQQFGIDFASEAMVDGVRTPVLERTLLITPVMAGTMVIPPFVRHLTMIDAENQRSETEISSEPLVIEVRSHDGLGSPGAWWLPAKSVKIIDSWDPAPDHIPFGETAQRTVTFEAVGTTADQLPPAPLLHTAGIIAFAGPTERQTIVTDAGPLARAVYHWRIRPISMTPSTVPELHIPWFDITTRQMREATAPEREVAFLDHDHEQQPTSKSTSSFHLGVRPLAASAIAFVWSLAIAYLIATMGTGHSAWPFRRAPKAIRDLKRAARKNDLQAFRRAIDELARSEREAWSRVSRQSEIAAGLASLNAALFASGAPAKPVALRPLADAIGRAWRSVPIKKPNGETLEF